MVQHHEVNFEGRHEHEDWNDDKTKYSGTPVLSLVPLYGGQDQIGWRGYINIPQTFSDPQIYPRDLQ